MKSDLKKIDFANAIDFSELFKYAEDFVGTKLSFVKSQAKSTYFGVTVNFYSNNVVDSCGIFTKALKFCVVESFDGWVIDNNDDGNIEYKTSVVLKFVPIEGGKNAITLFHARYVNGGWIFRSV